MGQQEGQLWGARIALILLLLCQTGALLFEAGLAVSEARQDANLVRQRGDEERRRRAFWREVSLRVASGQLAPDDAAALVTRPDNDDGEL